MSKELTLIVGNWRDGLDEQTRLDIEDHEFYEPKLYPDRTSAKTVLIALLDAYDEIMPDLIGDPA